MSEGIVSETLGSPTAVDGGYGTVAGNSLVLLSLGSARGTDAV